MAKVKFVPVPGNGYTGLFQGSDSACCACRLPKTRRRRLPARPGLEGLLWMASRLRMCPRCIRSAGQGQNYNFFANELSNYVSPDINNSASTILFSAG
jgi:hypothetical protein